MKVFQQVNIFQWQLNVFQWPLNVCSILKVFYCWGRANVISQFQCKSVSSLLPPCTTSGRIFSEHHSLIWRLIEHQPPKTTRHIFVYMIPDTRHIFAHQTPNLHTFRRGIARTRHQHTWKMDKIAEQSSMQIKVLNEIGYSLKKNLCLTEEFSLESCLNCWHSFMQIIQMAYFNHIHH